MRMALPLIFATAAAAMVATGSRQSSARAQRDAYEACIAQGDGANSGELRSEAPKGDDYKPAPPPKQ